MRRSIEGGLQDQINPCRCMQQASWALQPAPTASLNIGAMLGCMLACGIWCSMGVRGSYMGSGKLMSSARVACPEGQESRWARLGRVQWCLPRGW